MTRCADLLLMGMRGFCWGSLEVCRYVDYYREDRVGRLEALSVVLSGISIFKLQ